MRRVIADYFQFRVHIKCQESGSGEGTGGVATGKALETSTG